MYRRKKKGFIAATIVTGVFMVATLSMCLGMDGPIAIPIVLLCLFILFLALSIYFRNKDQHYWYPDPVEPAFAIDNGVGAYYLYKRIRNAFPELPVKHDFVFNHENFDKLHLECRCMRPTKTTIQKVAKDIWRHIGLTTKCPTIYIINKSGKARNGENNKVAGFSSTDYNERAIMITFGRGYSVDTIICLLAHEMAHFYQYDKGVIFDGWDAEILTDAMTAFFGLSAAFYEGRRWSYTITGSTTRTVYFGKIGYIPDIVYRELLVLIDNNADISKDPENSLFMLSRLYSSYKTMYQATINQANIIANSSILFPNKSSIAREFVSFLEAYPPETVEETLSRLERQFNDSDYIQLEEILARYSILDRCFHSQLDKRE